MTPDERQLIDQLFQRIGEASRSAPDKDHEADALIRAYVSRQPDAPYLLAQTVLVQEQALNAAQQRLQELERQVEETRRQTEANQPRPSGRSFLSGGLFAGGGPWGRSAPQQQQPASAQPGYSPGYPSPGYPPPGYPPPGYGPTGQPAPWGAQQSGGGGFLRSAMTTAAGVAGGALLFEGIQSLLGHHPGPFGSVMGGGAPTEIINETVNNYYDDQGSDQGGSRDASYSDQGADPGFQDASDMDTDSFDDGGGDDFA